MLIKTAANTRRLIAYAQPSARKGYLAGVPPTLVARIHQQAKFDISLVKADESYNHWIKAPIVEETHNSRRSYYYHTHTLRVGYRATSHRENCLSSKAD